jgi:hypothetical protein
VIAYLHTVGVVCPIWLLYATAALAPGQTEFIAAGKLYVSPLELINWFLLLQSEMLVDETSHLKKRAKNEVDPDRTILCHPSPVLTNIVCWAYHTCIRVT